MPADGEGATLALRPARGWCCTIESPALAASPNQTLAFNVRQEYCLILRSSLLSLLQHLPSIRTRLHESPNLGSKGKGYGHPASRVS